MNGRKEIQMKERKKERKKERIAFGQKKMILESEY